jgi:multiple sugar transport system permease protein
MAVTTDLVVRPVTPPAGPSGTIRRRRRRLGTNLTAYALLAGGVLCFALFSWYPTIRAFLLAFQHTNFVGTSQWVGWKNFHRLFADPEFVDAWRNSFEFSGIALVLGFGVPFVMAVVLNELRHLKTVFRLLVYLPVMIPPVVTAILWKWFYDPGNGLFNEALSAVHLPTSAWTNSTHTAIVSLVLVSTWANLGGTTLIYLAALQNIPAELYEAAELDGAGLWRRIRHVTIPQMRFIMLVLLLLQIVATMQVFIEPFQLTGFTDPSTITVMTLIYRYAFAVNNDFGLAASMSVLLFVVLGVLTALYLRVTRERD